MSPQSIRTNRLRPVLIAAVLVASLLPTTGALASHTPDPTSVTVAGSLQSEAGCPGDWDPACATTHLAYDADDDVWQGTFDNLPAGNYEYKAPLNDAWTENYGLHAVPDGSNIPLNLPSATNVKFYYDHKSHWITDNHGSTIAVAPGSFQSELGCAGDWDPGCLRSWLQDIDGDGIYTFETTALPAGSYESKVAINESWDENYGADGVLERVEHRLHRPLRRHEGHLHLRRDDARPHDRGRHRSWRARRSGRPVALRPGAQGLPGHRPEHRVEGLVHGRRRDAQRRLLPDGRQHQRRNPPVHRHGRRDLHRPPGPRHDVHGAGRDRHRRDGLQGDRVGQGRPVPHRDHLRHRPEPERRPDAARVHAQAQAQQQPRCSCSCASIRP